MGYLSDSSFLTVLVSHCSSRWSLRASGLVHLELIGLKALQRLLPCPAAKGCRILFGASRFASLPTTSWILPDSYLPPSCLSTSRQVAVSLLPYSVTCSIDWGLHSSGLHPINAIDLVLQPRAYSYPSCDPFVLPSGASST